jgi:hypothetical protein
MHLPATIDPRLISPVRKDLEAARQDVLSGIANTDAGRQVLAELVKSDTFAPVGKPTVLARMYRGPDGLDLGHAKGIDGKIVGNTRWVKISSVGSRLLTSAGMITGHLMLVEISSKLDRVQKDVGAIREALDDDRMGSLRAAIEGVHSALEARSPENKHALMTATIPDLQKAIHQTIAALKREIADVPSPKEWKVSRVSRIVNQRCARSWRGRRKPSEHVWKPSQLSVRLIFPLTSEILGAEPRSDLLASFKGQELVTPSSRHVSSYQATSKTDRKTSGGISAASCRR